MIHSRIKWLHKKEDATTKQKTIRSQNTISEKDCRDLTKITVRESMKVLIEVSRRSNCVEIVWKGNAVVSRRKERSNCVEIVWKGNAVVSRRKERERRFYKVGCSKVKLEQEGVVSCGKVCEEGLPKVNLEQEGEEPWDGCWRVRCEQKIRGARWVELELAVGVWGESARGGAGNF